MADLTAVKETVFLNFHLEPRAPLEVSELTSALGSIARQYEQFTSKEQITANDAEARLLISHVAPGSIDVNFIPDFHSVAGSMIPLMFDKVVLLTRFAERLKSLTELFLGKAPAQPIETSIKDCDDVINFNRPTAQHGGTQSINVVNGTQINNILNINVDDAKRAIEGATKRRSELTAGSTERKQRTSMVWNQLARDAAKTGIEKRSPDKGVIEEIDSKPHPVFFADELAYIKKEMIDDEENPYQKVFYVDVEISRLPGGKVGNYRIVGYHGKDDFPEG